MKPVESKPSGNPEKESPGIGMPAQLYLNQFGQLVAEAFGVTAYHVGSSLIGKSWRDVDVRVMMELENYVREFGDPISPHSNPKWCAMVKAFSHIGSAMTGLPIDFQIQEIGEANKRYQGSRSALFVVKDNSGHVCAPEPEPVQADGEIRHPAVTEPSINLWIDGGFFSVDRIDIIGKMIRDMLPEHRRSYKLYRHNHQEAEYKEIKDDDVVILSRDQFENRFFTVSPPL